MAPTRRVTQTTNITPREIKFKHKPCLNRQKIKLCNKIDSNIIKFENLVHASDRDGTVPYDHVMISIKHVISTKQQQLVVSI